MELVYILGSGSKWQDNELRYSLRSVEKFGQNVDGVTIIGQLPTWLRKVTYIKAADPYEMKCDNAWLKIHVACMQLKRPFVLMNDDFFLLQPTDFNNLPRYYDGDMKDLIGRYHKSSPYVKCQAATYHVLQQNNLPTRNYAVHYPVTIDPARMQKVWGLFKRQPGISFRNLYGNLVGSDNDVQFKDNKISEALHTHEIAERLEGWSMFSIGDKFLNEAGKQYLHMLYPDASRYE